MTKRSPVSVFEIASRTALLVPRTIEPRMIVLDRRGNGRAGLSASYIGRRLPPVLGGLASLERAFAQAVNADG